MSEIVTKNKKRYICDNCGHTFSRKFNLQRHIKTRCNKNAIIVNDTKRLREKKHCCEQCGKNFANKQNKNRHIKTYCNKNAIIVNDTDHLPCFLSDFLCMIKMCVGL